MKSITKKKPPRKAAVGKGGNAIDQPPAQTLHGSLLPLLIALATVPSIIVFERLNVAQLEE